MNTSPETRHAIFAGIAAPAILLNIISGASEAGNRRQAHAAILSWDTFAKVIVPTARAQDTTIKTQPGGDFSSGFSSGFTSVQISPAVSGGIPASTSIPVTAEYSKAGKVETIHLGEITDLNAVTSYALPDGWKIYVSGKPVTLTGPITKVNLRVKTKTSAFSDFLWALGLPRNYTIEEIAIPNPK